MTMVLIIQFLFCNEIGTYILSEGSGYEPLIYRVC